MGGCKLSGQIPSGQTVTVSGGSGIDSSTTLTSNPVTNQGVLVLDSPAGDGYALIEGDRLLNDGTVRTQVEGASFDDLEVNLENTTTGKLEVKSGELREDQSTTTANEGAVTIDAAAKLTFTSAGAVFTNETNGTMAFELASATSFGKFELSSGGLHVSGGHIDPVLAAGYNPVGGTEYHVITGTHAGTFASVGGGFKADYSNVTFIGLVAPTAPTVTELSPPEGGPGGYESVIIHGTGFITGEGAVKVKFGEDEAPYASAQSPTEILVDTPSHALGHVPVTVTDENGTSSGGPEYLFRIPPPTPVVFGATPSEGPAAGGQPVTISGENFLPDSIATIGGRELLEAHVVNTEEITGKTPPGEAGVYAEINVADENGNSGEGPSYTYVAAPAITSVAPAEGVSTGGTHVTIKGTGFTEASSVKFGGVAAKGVVTYVGSTELKAESPAGSGTVDITVETIGGPSAKVTADQFTYLSPPTVTSVSPTEAPEAGGAVTIEGAGFSTATAVSFGAAPAAKYKIESATKIIAESPEGKGTVAVVVTSSGGTSAEAPADDYTYDPVPSIVEVFPGEGPASGGTQVTVTGTGFTKASRLTFDSKEAKATTYVSPTKLTAETPPGVGTADVIVETAGGKSGGMVGTPFVYISAPTVTKLTPAEGPEAGKTSVTIEGSGFTGATAVSFGATAALKYKVESPTTIVAEAPAGSGTAAVTVKTAGGTSAEAQADVFTYIGTPSVSKLRPNEGTEEGETEVTIEGSGFTGVSSVKFGAVAALRVTDFGPTELRAVSPAGTGTVPVRVTTEHGTSPEVPQDLFKYVAEPKGRLGGLDLAGYCQRQGETETGVWAGGKEWSVTLLDEEAEGENYAFGNWACYPNHYESGPSFLTIAETGPAPSFEGACAEQYPGFDSYGHPEDPNNANSWICFAVEPKVEKVAPAAGSTLGNNEVVITGSGLKGAARVEFGSTPATSFKVESSTEIVATTAGRQRFCQRHGHDGVGSKRSQRQRRLRLHRATYRHKTDPNRRPRGRHQQDHGRRLGLHRRNGGQLRRNPGDQIQSRIADGDHRRKPPPA